MVLQQSLKKEPFSKSSSSQNSVPFSITFLTLFPEVLEPFLLSSLLGKAREKNLVSFSLIQIRDFATDRHRSVDDSPYGGGPGMLMRADVLKGAWEKACEGFTEKPRTVLLSPQGKLFTQEIAKNWSSKRQPLILVCGHYEGVDERFIETCVDEEISIGDYVLTGGEIPALALADTIVRLLPGVVGNPDSIKEESLEQGLLKYPQYTRPPVFEGMPVPEILLSGDHQAIAKWRVEQSQSRTRKKRPDLLKK